jgi:hypothetical protein
VGFAKIFGQTEIAELDMALGVEEYVFGLEVTINDADGVEIVQSERDFGSVEPSIAGIDATELFHMEVEFAAREKF